MKKSIRRILKTLGVGFLLILLAMGASAFFLQTKKGREVFLSTLKRSLAKDQVEISFGKVEGVLPFTWKIENVEIQTPHEHLHIDEARLRVNLWRLWKKEIALKELAIHRLVFTRIEREKTEREGKIFPYPVYIKHFSIERVEGDLSLSSVEGKGRMGKNSFFFDVKAKDPDLQIKAKGRHGRVSVEAEGNIQQVAFSTTLEGSLLAFKTLLLQPEKERLPIQGKASGTAPQVDAFSSEFTLFSDRSLDVHRIYAKNTWGDLEGQGDFTPGFQLREAKASVKVTDLSRVFPDMKGSFSSEVLVKGAFTTDETFKGTLGGAASVLSENGEVTACLSWNRYKGLVFEEFHAVSPWVEMSGSFTVSPQGKVQGESRFQIDDLYRLHSFFPDYPLYGSLGGAVEKTADTLSWRLHGYDLFYQDIHTAEIDAEIEGKESVSMQMRNLRIHGFPMDSVRVQARREAHAWSYDVQAFHPSLDIASKGFWRCEKGECLFDIQELAGHILLQPFDMPKPTQVAWSGQKWKVDDFALALANGSLSFKALFSEKNSYLDLTMDRFPIDFLSFNPLEVAVKGTLSLDAHVTQDTGSLKMELEHLETAELGEMSESVSGVLSATFEKGRLSYDGQILIGENEIIESRGNVPLRLDLYKRDFHFPRHAPLHGEFIYDARAERILDFVNIGPHRFEADIRSHLMFKGTWNDLKIEGAADVFNGTYDNYYTGMHIEEIKAHFVGEKDGLLLESVSGKDGQKGSFLGQGKFLLDPEKNYPFRIHAEFSDLISVDIPLVFATSEGTIDIHGDKSSAVAEGSVKVVKAEFSIPERIPSSISSLNVEYVNEPKVKTEERKKSLKRKPYPLHLQLSILAPNNIFIRGRGLTSEWQGDFRIGGTYDDISAKGKLELMKGEFSFSGKNFDLVQGSLTFTGQSGVPPYLDISGKIDQKGITILSNLKGRLNAPHLTFKSVPALPVSAILSYLIFGQDISEISVLQAGQLAAAAASLSGEGPDVLELARKTLGVDRLAVITTPSAEGADSTSLQIGKYLTRGILFSVSQGIDQSSGNVSVEVDLTHGFIFQAETIQQQEQGRFTLKWNVNY